jgi:hypothetical protein
VKWKTKHSISSEQFQNQIEYSQKQATSILQTCIYIRLVLWAKNSFLMNDEIMQVFFTSRWNVNLHIISLELKGGRESWNFRKLHYQLLYNLSFSYLSFSLLFWCCCHISAFFYDRFIITAFSCRPQFSHLYFILWYVGILLSPYFLPFIYNIWFSFDFQMHMTAKMWQIHYYKILS